MGGPSATHHDARPGSRRAATLAAAAAVWLTVSCGGDVPESRDSPRAPSSTTSSSQPDQSGPTDPTTAPSPQTEATDDAGALPEVPTTRSAAAFAGHLDLALATLRAGGSSPTEVQQAAEFHQLAARALARASEAFRRKVIARLEPEEAALIRGEIRAATMLGGMTSPQPALPRWRIVEPPPATRLQDHYREAQRRTGVPWNYLAAIHLVETRMGRIRGTSTAGARGPMQFLPSTWARYGAGGDINDPRDAIHGAARLLKANRAPGDMATALWHYNPSQSYVRAVTEYARAIKRSEWIYRSYWHWRVLYRHVRGTYVLPVGYPATRPVLVARD